MGARPLPLYDGVSQATITKESGRNEPRRRDPRPESGLGRRTGSARNGDTGAHQVSPPSRRATRRNSPRISGDAGASDERATARPGSESVPCELGTGRSSRPRWSAIRSTAWLIERSRTGSVDAAAPPAAGGRGRCGSTRSGSGSLGRDWGCWSGIGRFLGHEIHKWAPIWMRPSWIRKPTPTCQWT